MEKLRPKLFSVLKTYTREQFMKDVISGILVAVIALPLSIALALASGVTPEKGLYTAITAGFIISFLGGSRVQIAGPTAAFATIVAGIVARYDMEGLIVATLMAGIILIIMGLLRFGSLMKYIPYTITAGFTAGIAVTIVIGQLKDFFGLTIVTEEPLIESMEKLTAFVHHFGTLNPQAALVGVICLTVLIGWQYLPGVISRIPPSLAAIFVGVFLVKGVGLQVNTIGDLYEISNRLPQFSFPAVDFTMIRTLLPDAFTIAVLAAIESLLSCVVADSMIQSRHNSNMELIAQGAGNMTSALFGGIPATGAIARTAANIKNGGRTPVAGMVHAVTLLLILVVLMPYAGLIPMPTIAAILFMIAYHMCGWRKCVSLIKTAPKSDSIVLGITFALTVVFDLVVAIEVGILFTCLLFLRRMSEVTEVDIWKPADEEAAQEEERLTVPAHIRVYEISGPLFFAVADKIMRITLTPEDKCLILRMRSVNAIDATAMQSLEELYLSCQEKGITLILSHLREQPMRVMKKTGFLDKVGSKNCCRHIEEALQRAENLVH